MRYTTELGLFVPQLIHRPFGPDIHDLWGVTAAMLEHILQARETW